MLGLAYRNSSMSGAKTLLDNMMSQFIIPKKVFSIWFGQTCESLSVGELFFGGSDPNYYFGNFTYINVSVQGHWKFAVNGYSI